MNIREKVVRGFAETYIDNEQVIIRDLLQSGRIDKEEWQRISQDLQSLAQRYRDGKISATDYIKNRNQIREEFNRSKEEKQPGLTREEADKMCEEIAEDQKQALKKAYMESSSSTIKIAFKILAARVKFTAARLKNI